MESMVSLPELEADVGRTFVEAVDEVPEYGCFSLMAFFEQGLMCDKGTISNEDLLRCIKTIQGKEDIHYAALSLISEEFKKQGIVAPEIRLWLDLSSVKTEANEMASLEAQIADLNNKLREHADAFSDALSSMKGGVFWGYASETAEKPILSASAIRRIIQETKRRSWAPPAYSAIQEKLRSALSQA